MDLRLQNRTTIVATSSNEIKNAAAQRLLKGERTSQSVLRLRVGVVFIAISYGYSWIHNILATGNITVVQM